MKQLITNSFVFLVKWEQIFDKIVSTNFTFIFHEKQVSFPKLTLPWIMAHATDTENVWQREKITIQI